MIGQGDGTVNARIVRGRRWWVPGATGVGNRLTADTDNVGPAAEFLQRTK